MPTVWIIERRFERLADVPSRGRQLILPSVTPMTIWALDPNDARTIEMNVAGPAALLIAKLHKLGERQTAPRRLIDKDAHDVYRLLVSTESAQMTATLRQLRENDLCDRITNDALVYLEQLFADGPGALGAMMAGRVNDRRRASGHAACSRSSLSPPSSRTRSSSVMSSGVPRFPSTTAALRFNPRSFARFMGLPLNAALNSSCVIARSSSASRRAFFPRRTSRVASSATPFCRANRTFQGHTSWECGRYTHFEISLAAGSQTFAKSTR
jgi:hypothetical protein